ncbi:MAG: YjjG family noncanonical pyrimidine nucleotidase [Bernardetiaceae bacterium]|nr:YjjG family noncanonical pyrimidine nucleotidase [Bernardetiaceae bacterium]
MKNKFKHIFFDLDHTLWDYERNSAVALAEVYANYKLEEVWQVALQDFERAFRQATHALWDRYNRLEIDKIYIHTHRFAHIAEILSVPTPKDIEQLENAYQMLGPDGKILLPYSREVLEYLQHKNYKLHILSNGFDGTQHRKLKATDITQFFSHIITSETTGARKPHRNMFEYALSIAPCQAEEAIMIGDNWEADIKGAVAAGLAAIFYNPQKEEKEQIPQVQVVHCLSEIKNYL